MDYDSPPVTIASPAGAESGHFQVPLFIPNGPRCPPHQPDEIVVCAEDPETFRLRPLPNKFADPVPQAWLKIGENTTMGTELESAGVGGQVSNRVMIRGKLKF
jgi:hypothetical protein